MVFAHHEDSADLCATDVKEIAYTSTMELVLHHESSCIRYQYSYMLVERRTIPLWPNDDRQAELVSKESSYADSTECIGTELMALLLEAMGFACNEDNADLSCTNVNMPTTFQLNLFCPTRRADVFVISILHMIGEIIIISSWYNNDRQAEVISKMSTKCRPNLIKCLERAFPDIFQWFI